MEGLVASGQSVMTCHDARCCSRSSFTNDYTSRYVGKNNGSVVTVIVPSIQMAARHVINPTASTLSSTGSAGLCTRSVTTWQIVQIFALMSSSYPRPAFVAEWNRPLKGIL